MTVTSVVGVTSTPRLTPYLSVDMFKTNRRSGVNTDNLVAKGRAADQDAALAGYIEEASVWMDDFAQQILAATVDTVLDRVNVGRDGYATIHPRYRPVLAVTGFAIGATPDRLVPYTDLSGIGVRLDGFTVPVGRGGLSLPVNTPQGPIQFGRGLGWLGDQAWTQYSYQNGAPVTYLTAPVAAGVTSVPVADTTGIIAGLTWMTIYAGAHRAHFLVTGVSTADAGGAGTGPGMISFAQPLRYPVENRQDYPTYVSGLPSSMNTVCTLVTRAFIKDSGGGSTKNLLKSDADSGDDLDEAAGMLRAYVAPIE